MRVSDNISGTLNPLVDECIFLCSEARQSDTIAIASLSYDIVDCYFGS